MNLYKRISNKKRTILNESALFLFCVKNCRTKLRILFYNIGLNLFVIILLIDCVVIYLFD